jgi:uncharacterized protein (DUF1800 family)
MLKAVSRTPAMLQFLNNQQNRKGAPNENFARELMELFTLGPGAYGEQDIHEAARAFTGWSFDRMEGTFRFRREWHDDGSKTFRGRTGNWDGDDILEMILDDPQCADFICGKIYRWFIHPEPDREFVAEMSRRFRGSDHDIGDLMRFVFSSDHFLEERNMASRIKSPVDLLCGLGKVFRISYALPESPLFLQRSMGQALLHPPSVAGWTDGRGWIDSNSMMARLKLPSALLDNGAIDWQDPETSPAEMDRMIAAEGDAPMRDARGRRIATTVDRDRFLAQLPASPGMDELSSLLLCVPPSDALRRSISANDTWQRTLQILSSPEYQLC